jgi:hypothetical protein
VSDTCDHQWERLPVVDFSMTYLCQDCRKALQVSWIGLAGRPLDDIDRAFGAVYGGTVIGAVPPGPLEQEPAWIEYLTGMALMRDAEARENAGGAP